MQEELEALMEATLLRWVPRAPWIALLDLANRGLGHVELAVVVQSFLDAVGGRGPEVDGLDGDLLVRAWDQRPIGVAADRRVQDQAALALGKRRHVGPAAREAEAKRSLGSDEHAAL